MNAAANTPCLSTCGSDCSACLADVVAAITSATVVNATVAAQLAQAVVAAHQDASTAGTPFASTLADATSLANATVEVAAVAVQAQAAMPQVYTVHSSPFFVGRTPGTVADQLRAIWSSNIQRLANTFATALLGVSTAPISLVFNMSVSWGRDVSSMTGSRRRSIPVTPTAIIVTFTYNITCMPNDMICQSGASNTPLYNAFSAALGISYSSFSPILPRCLLLGPAAISANSIYNITCLSELATTSCMGLFNQGVSESMARNMTSMMLFNMTRCGIQPPEPSGNCYDLSYISTALSNSSSIAAACKCSDGSDVAGSSAGSGAVGAAAGGAGAGILIILVIVIIVVVMRRKKNRQAPEAKKVPITYFP